MNPITVNSAIAIDYALRANAEQVRRAEERRLAAQFKTRRPWRRRRLVATRPEQRRWLATA